jgi:hypothetical protein
MPVSSHTNSAAAASYLITIPQLTQLVNGGLKLFHTEPGPHVKPCPVTDEGCDTLTYVWMKDVLFSLQDKLP